MYSIQSIIAEYPEDAKNNDGKRIWMGALRFPSVMTYDAEDEYVQAFVISTAKILGKYFGIPAEEDKLLLLNLKNFDGI